MPQMSPMNWLYLNFFFLTLFLIILIIIFFTKNISFLPKNYQKKNNFFKLQW